MAFCWHSDVFLFFIVMGIVFFFKKYVVLICFLWIFDDILVSLWWPFGGTLVAFYESDTKVAPTGGTLVSLS